MKDEPLWIGDHSRRTTLQDDHVVASGLEHAWNRPLMGSSRWRLAGEVKDPFVIPRTLSDRIDPTVPEENIATLKLLRIDGFRLGLISNADMMGAEGWADSPLCGLPAP